MQGIKRIKDSKVVSVLVNIFDKSVISQSLPGFGVKQRQRKREKIERQRKERTSSSVFSLLLSVIMAKQII